MAITYKIPKLTDREIVAALARIRDEMGAQYRFRVHVDISRLGDIDISQHLAETAKVKFVFDLESQVAERFHLQTDAGPALTIHRRPAEITDHATIPDDWQNHFGRGENRDQFAQHYFSFVAAVRKEFRVSDAEAALKGDGDSEWHRYRNAQTQVLSSLESAAKNLIVEASKNAAVLDAQRAERFQRDEAKLREDLQKEREAIQAEFDKKKAEVEAREKAAADREADFNTKESHFVARQKQDAQIKEIKEWLSNWALTKGTSRKRIPVLGAYFFGILASGTAAAVSIWHNYEIMKSVTAVAALAWWQWLIIAAKVIVPFALFATFLIALIRWATSWARQHAEEEFRNRALLIDVGRAGWLLEAVRDAQVRNAQLPETLLKELSRNLFSFSSNSDRDAQPHTVGDMLTQGLSKLRIKQSADSTEIEAEKGK